jgi:formylglycine-generating enzyme required for sulfatase activity
MSVTRTTSQLAACAAVIALGCGNADPRPQWTVVISTDAPVPQLGDRLLVEVLDDSAQIACSACRRVFAAGTPSTWPISFGVAVPESGRRMRVRARLYRTDHVGFDGAPLGAAHLDALAALPSGSAAMQVSLPLAMPCFGVPSDPIADTTCERGLVVAAHALAPSDSPAILQTGSWSGAQPIPCAKESPNGMVCVPGGAFLIGAPNTFPSSNASAQETPERLVQLDPFAIDRDEITVGMVRHLVATGAIVGEPALRSTNSKSLAGACTYLGASDPKNDALPINCISHGLGSAVCAALGKRLPTEAEWEYAAGNTSRETVYPWGYDDDVCKQAIVGRGRTPGIETDDFEVVSCRVVGDKVLPWGPVVGGSTGDVTDLGVRNLGGNVREWVSDELAAYDSPCWIPGSPALVNPNCKLGKSPLRTARGGAWDLYPLDAKAAERSGSAIPLPTIGFRCAMSMASPD